MTEEPSFQNSSGYQKYQEIKMRKSREQRKKKTEVPKLKYNAIVEFHQEKPSSRRIKPPKDLLKKENSSFEQKPSKRNFIAENARNVGAFKRTKRNITGGNVTERHHKSKNFSFSSKNSVPKATPRSRYFEDFSSPIMEVESPSKSPKKVSEF